MTAKVTSENIILVAQFLLTGTLFVGFFTVLGLVTLGRAQLPNEQVRLMDTLCGVLGTLCTQAAAYWFARQRSSTQGTPA